MRALLLTLLLAGGARASGEHEAGAGARTGAGKAVLEASAERGLKLAEKAARRLGLRTAPLAGPAPFRFPAKALVYTKEEVGVYRLREGWYKRVDVELMGKERGSALARSAGLKAGDQVVVAGAPLLRVAELDILAEKAEHDH